MARGGRGGRGGRAGSSEPTRSSRRLRSSQEPEDVAPLLEGLPPVKKGRGRPKKTETITEETESYEDAPATSFDTQTTTSSIDPAEYTSSPHEAPPTSETDPAITVEKKTTEIITNDDKEVDEEPTEAPHATIESDEATGPYNDLYNGEHQSSSVFAEREQKQCNEQRERPRQPRRKSRKLLLQLPPTPSPPPKRVPPVTEPASTEAALRGMEEAIRQAELQEARKREELKKKKEAELARYLQEEHNRAIHGYDSEEDSLDGDIVPFRCKAKTLVPMTGDLVAAKMADGAFLGRSISGSDDRDNLFAYTTLPRDSVDALELLFFNQPNSNLLSLVQTLDDATITAFMTARLRTRHSQTRDHDDLNRVKHHMLEFATHYITDMGVARRLLVNTRLQLEQHAERNRELEMMHEKDQEAIEAMQRELASGKQQPGIRPVMKAKRSNVTATPQSSSNKRRLVTAEEADGETGSRSSKQPKMAHFGSDAATNIQSSSKNSIHALSTTKPKQLTAAALRDREAKKFFEAEQRKEAQRKRDKASSEFRRRHGRAPTTDELDAAMGIERPERAQQFIASPAEASTPERHEPETPMQVPTTVRDRFGLSSVWRSIGSAFVRPFSFASPQRQLQQVAEPTSPTPATQQPSHHDSPLVSDTSPESPEQTSNTQASAADKNSDMDEVATPATPVPQTQHTQQTPMSNDDQEMGDEVQSPSTPTPASAPATQHDNTTAQALQNPQLSVKTGRWAKSTKQRMREQKQRETRKENDKMAAEAATREERERQEKEKEAARVAVIQSKRGKEAAHLKRYPIPNHTITELHRLRDMGIHVNIRRKVRADWLDPIPEREDGRFAVPEPDDDEEWDTEVYYLTNKGYLADKEEGDLVYEYDELDRQEAVRKGLASPPPKRARFGDNLESGPTPAPAWKTGNAGPFSGSLNDAGSSLRSALKPSTNFAKSTGPRNRAQPYTGAIFGGGSSAGGDGGNIFGSPNNRKRKQGFTAEEERAIAYAQKNHVWTGPKIAPKPGQFSVPDDSDDDTESVVSDRDTSEMSLVEADTAAKPEATRIGDANQAHQNQPRSVFWDSFQADVAAKRAADAAEQAQRDGKAAGEITQAEKTAEEAAQKARDTRAGTLKPTETPASPKSSITSEAGATPSISNSNSEAVARARAQAEKWKPKTPSRLQEASRLSSSPIVPNSDARTPRGSAVTASTPTPDTGQMTAAVETASTAPTVPAPAGGLSTAAVEEAGGKLMTEEYRKSLQYARDLAVQELVGEDDPYANFAWPKGETIQGPATGDPAVAAAIKRWMESPQFEVDVAAWDHVWAPYRQDAPTATV